jgi:polar amino acid transport system permease protein
MNFQFQFAPVFGEWQMIAAGAALTLGLSAMSFVLGTAVAIVLAAAQLSGRPVVRALIRLYIEAIRNTPFLVQLLILYFGLPSVGIRMNANAVAVLALVVNLAAYATEIIRAGVDATHRSQIEAAQSLALTPAQVFIYVVLKPALAKTWPALCSQFILLMLGSSLCSLITVEELSSVGAFIDSRTFRSFEAYIVIAGVYLLLANFFTLVLGWLGRRLFPFYSGPGRVRMVGGQ